MGIKSKVGGALASSLASGSPVPAILSGIGGLLGQRNANKANQKEALKNRNFQERMRNTQWQAGVEDMRKAGLNPALAYSQGPAASPGGSLASPQQDVLSGGISSAQATIAHRKQMRLLDEQLLAQQNANMMSSLRSGRISVDLDGDNQPDNFLVQMLKNELSQARSMSAVKGVGGAIAPALTDASAMGGSGLQMIMQLLTGQRILNPRKRGNQLTNNPGNK